MNILLNTKDKKALLAAIESNLDDFYVKCSHHPNFELAQSDTINWVRAKYVDWPNCIFKVNFKNLDIDAEINQIKALIQNKEAPNAWTLGPLTEPSSLGSKLEQFGFLNVYQQAGMVLNLQDLTKLDFKSIETEIKIVDNLPMLQEWSKIVSLVFNLKVDLDLLKYLLYEKEARFYLGYYNGKPATTLLLYLSSGVGGLHAVSTLQEFRNKGLGLIISGRALKDALKLGYKVGVLQASKIGESVYRKLGFKKQCDIFSYELQS
ncbi:MAG: GNAT family N-acetyltransferase [Candidatus Hodarchaeota archaeon]